MRIGRLTPTDMDTVLAAPLFSDLGRAAVKTLIEGATVVEFPEAGLLFSKGDVADRFFVVLEGRVDLFALTEAGDESVIEVFDKGWTFAEAAMFASGLFPLNAQATAGTRLLQVPREPFMRRLSENRDLALRMLAALSRWHGHLLHEIDELKRRSPVQRLAAYLLYLSNADEGPVGVRLPVSKTLLASRIGMAPESLSRAMARLKGLGVEMKGRDVVINDVAALRQFCEADSLRMRTNIKVPIAGAANSPLMTEVTLDVRPLLARGEDPLARVLDAAEALPPQGRMQLDAPFDPAPLRRILAGRRFSTHARRLAEGHWRVEVRRDGRGAITGDAGTADACPGDAGTPVWEVDDTLHIDVRCLTPPQPMLAILRLIHTLDRPREIIVHHERMPEFLVPELAEIGWALERIPGEPGEVRLRLTKSRQ